MPLYVLVGPNQGRSGVWGGFKFTEGACQLTRQEAELAGHVLSGFYSAYPVEIAEEKQREYDKLQDSVPPVAAVTVPVVSAIVATAANAVTKDSDVEGDGDGNGDGDGDGNGDGDGDSEIISKSRGKRKKD